MNAAEKQSVLESAATKLENYVITGTAGFLQQAIDRLVCCGITVTAHMRSGDKAEAVWMARMIRNGDVF